ncbi:MAG: WGR domain-containing protein [Caldilineaceae bacterium]|nr:WGR domain-containing protein [Caldilineaceae bacterium]
MSSTTNTTLIRVDLEKHMDRRYSVAIQPTLLDPVAVVCFWGSRRSSYQRMQVHPATTREEAEQVAEKIVRGKIRRGYLPE